MPRKKEDFDPTDPADIDGPFESESITILKADYEKLLVAAQDGLILGQIEEYNLDVMRVRAPSEPRFKWFVGRSAVCGEDLQTAWANFREAQK